MMLNQLCGINGIVIDSTGVISEVPNLNINLGNDLIVLGGLIGAATGPFLGKLLSIKTIFVIGEVGMAICLVLSALFQGLKLPYALMVFVMLFMFVYQSTLGTYFLVYAAIVGNESITTIAVFMTWFFILIISLITPPLIINLGVIATFGFFAVCALIGAGYFSFFMKRTEGLSKEECKVLYAPAEYRKAAISDLNESYAGDPLLLVKSNHQSLNPI